MRRIGKIVLSIAIGIALLEAIVRIGLDDAPVTRAVRTNERGIRE